MLLGAAIIGSPSADLLLANPIGPGTLAALGVVYLGVALRIHELQLRRHLLRTVSQTRHLIVDEANGRTGQSAKRKAVGKSDQAAQERNPITEKELAK